MISLAVPQSSTLSRFTNIAAWSSAATILHLCFLVSLYPPIVAKM